MLLAGACSATPASVAPPQSASPAATPSAAATASAAASASEAASASLLLRPKRLHPRRPPPPPPARAPPRSRRIRPRRSSRTSSRVPTITFWTFYLSPTFDQYIKDTIDRFKATYPGVKVKWEDHQATFKDDLNNAFSAGNAPGRHQPLGQRGLGQRVRRQGPAPRPQQHGPEARPGHLLPGSLERAAHQRRELPVPLVPGPQRRADQQGHLGEGRPDRGRSSPRPSTACPRCARRSSTRPQTVCAIRLTVSDLLAQMVYEGNVKVFSDDGKAFAFNSPEGVAWLQMYVDMVNAGTVDTPS